MTCIDREDPNAQFELIQKVDFEKVLGAAECGVPKVEVPPMHAMPRITGTYIKLRGSVFPGIFYDYRYEVLYVRIFS